TDHHAIIPTGQSPVGLQGDEKLLYHLIAMRFIGAFYPDCQFEATTVLGKAGEYEFKASGKVILSPGWRALLPQKQTDTAADPDEGVLPAFTEGECGPHVPSLAKKTSQPPKYYTEGTLLRAMETAGKTVDDETLREALKDNGIGRPSTRAAIIETLFKRRYIYRSGKSIMASQAGIDLIATIHEELLKSASLTGIWENKLRKIERGEYSAAQFIREISDMIRQIVINVLSDNSMRRIVTSAPDETSKARRAQDQAEKPKKPRAPRITKLEQVVCPLCGTGHLLKGRAAFGCSNYAAGCTFRLPFEECPPETTPAQINRRINGRKKK
ncbi:MAG: DNA topoisomerase III, partial [Muribaculaceae bacterium]|nr:DNA topoisomerase III [Muribaculaceae bacterium]